MNDQERRALGEQTIKDVYAGDVVVPPEGYAFTDVMLKQLFAELWTRDTLSMRDKRILLLGIIAEKGEGMTFKIQAKASLKRGTRCITNQDVDISRFEFKSYLITNTNIVIAGKFVDGITVEGIFTNGY